MVSGTRLFELSSILIEVMIASVFLTLIASTNFCSKYAQSFTPCAIKKFLLRSPLSNTRK